MEWHNPLGYNFGKKESYEGNIMQKGVQLNFNKRYSFIPILPGPFECIPPPPGFILDFEVKVRKLIEDIIIISRQELHQAKDFTTLR